MISDAGNLLAAHWKLVLCIWLGSNAISAMPSPTYTGWRSNAAYKYLFAFMHGSAGNIPRVLAVLFPQLVTAIAKRFLGVNVSPESVGETTSTADTKAADAVAGK